MSSDEQWGAGDRTKWSDHGSVMVGKQRYPLVYGEHPHSRQDNRHYVDMGGKEPEGFDGHRILIGVNIECSNYLKDSNYSGREVRKGGSATITADGVVVWEFFFRDPQWALLKAHQLVGELSEHSSGWLMKRERDRLVGRKIFYDRTPAIITSLIEDQGCMMIQPDGVDRFPPPVYAKSENDDYEDPDRLKVAVTDPKIWWFRDN
jgi:hypothetical protein